MGFIDWSCMGLIDWSCMGFIDWSSTYEYERLITQLYTLCEEYFIKEINGNQPNTPTFQTQS